MEEPHAPALFLKTTVGAQFDLEIPRIVNGYEFIRVIAEGSYSILCLVRHLITNISYACKVVSRSVLKLDTMFECFDRELRILQSISHPNIVQLIDVVYTTDIILVIMEYCAGGDLLTAVQDEICYDHYQCRRILQDVLLALQYLHERNISHRDIKLDNILLTESRTAKLADFGLSRHIVRDGLLGTPCGSVEYCAPEILRGEQYDGRKVDIWSLGVVLYAMCSGGMPWTSHDAREVRAQVLAGRFELPRVVPPVIRSVIERMMDPDPEQRPTVSELLEDPWVSAQLDRQRQAAQAKPGIGDKAIGVKTSASLWMPGRGKMPAGLKMGLVVRPMGDIKNLSMSLLRQTNLAKPATLADLT
jgi:serine/threonine protein kinase